MSDLILFGGTVVTMDPSQRRCQALLVRDNRIVVVGTNEEVRAAARTDAAEVDLRGRALLPGFNDSHIHALNLGEQETWINLGGLSKAEIIDKLKIEASTRSPREMLFGSNWDYPACPDPHIRDLDQAFPDRPVVLMQFSGHGGWVNSAALRKLRITPSRATWTMGGAEMDESGRFTGILREPGSAPGLLFWWLKRALNRASLRDALDKALAILPEHGITSVQDNTWFPWVVPIIARAQREGRQTVRFSCWSFGGWGPADRWFGLKRFDPQWYSRGPRKHFWDGAFSSHTAWLSEPYADSSDTRGHGMEADAIEPILRRAIKARRQLVAHSIGDAATHAYVDAFSRVADMEGARALRFRVEHGQLIQPDDVKRMADLELVVSAQPHAAANPQKDISLIGPERAQAAYPYRSLLDAGVRLAFGSDCPGENTYDPLYGVHLAVNRAGPQAISVDEALEAYTSGSAYAEFREAEKGRLVPGYLADMVVLSADPEAVDPLTIKEISVDMTFVDGRCVFERPA